MKRMVARARLKQDIHLYQFVCVKCGQLYKKADGSDLPNDSFRCGDGEPCKIIPETELDQYLKEHRR
jgi:hypothetical protein